VRGSGTRITIAWSAATNARRYGIMVRQANGVVMTLTVRATERHAVIENLSKPFSGTVTVAAVGGLPGVFGKRARAPFKAVGPRGSSARRSTRGPEWASPVPGDRSSRWGRLRLASSPMLNAAVRGNAYANAPDRAVRK
jgi:hypothetical protein